MTTIPTITQADLDKLADIVWWVKGYHAADQPGCPFTGEHIKSLSKARDSMSLHMDKKKEQEEFTP